MDKVCLNQMAFYGYHGVFPEEQKLGQHFYVDLTLEGDFSEAAQTDDVEKSVHYGRAFERVQQVVEGKPYQLVESVTEAVAQEMLQTFPIVVRCSVKVIKPDPPIPGHYDSVAVEMTRERK